MSPVASRRPRSRAPLADRSDRRAAAPLIGLDVSRTPIRLRTRSWAPLVVAGILGAMFLAVLRVDVIRTRFALAESVAEEIRLQDAKRELTVAMRTLRDPAELSRRARELGFGRAERLIDLPARHAAPTPERAPGGPIAPAPPLRPGVEFDVARADRPLGAPR